MQAERAFSAAGLWSARNHFSNVALPLLPGVPSGTPDA